MYVGIPLPLRGSEDCMKIKKTMYWPSKIILSFREVKRKIYWENIWHTQLSRCPFTTYNDLNVAIIDLELLLKSSILWQK